MWEAEAGGLHVQRLFGPSNEFKASLSNLVKKAAGTSSVVDHAISPQYHTCTHTLLSRSDTVKRI